MQLLRKKNRKKGFTITELVIVIAVIAILASVMIVSYTSVLSSANETAALEEARSEWTNLQVETIYGNVKTGTTDDEGEPEDLSSDDLSTGKFTIINSGYTDYVFQVEAGTFNADPLDGVTYTTVTGDSSTYGTALEYEEANSSIAIYYLEASTEDE